MERKDRKPCVRSGFPRSNALSMFRCGVLPFIPIPSQSNTMEFLLGHCSVSGCGSGYPIIVYWRFVSCRIPAEPGFVWRGIHQPGGSDARVGQPSSRGRNDLASSARDRKPRFR